MSDRRDIGPSAWERGAPTRTMLLGLGVAVAVLAAAALTVPMSGLFGSLRLQPGIPAAQGPQPDVFAARFPMELAVPPLAAQREIYFRQGSAKLADAMRQATPAMPAAPPAATDGGPRVPVPRSRPVAAGLMANAGAAGDPGRQPTGPSSVSEAIRNVFAMLPPGLQLASINPDGGLLGNGQDKPVDLSAYGEQTAVYDITGRTVHMPDGSRLEAHSGFGDLMDDVQNVHVRDRGATPPNVYELSLREKLFHGVQALRLKPVGEGELYGRNGLLAHSYLLGPNGQSNGCVSFKDYEAFLKAYSSGSIKRLVVVRSVSDDTFKVARRI